MSESLQNLKLYILKEFNLTEKSFEDDVQILRKWIGEQPHFPKVELDDMMLGNFLTRSKFSIERAKQKVDAYFTIRTQVPEIYMNLNPNRDPDQELYKTNMVVLLPKKPEDIADYFVIKFTKNNLNFLFMVQQVIRTVELMLRKTHTYQEVLIVDVSNAVFDDIYQVNLFLLSKSMTAYLSICSIRLKAIYILYTPSYGEKCVSIIKHVLKPKLLKRIHLEKDHSCLATLVSSCQIPPEYGGTGPSLEELAEKQYFELMKHQDLFEEISSNNMAVNEDLRPVKLIGGNDGYFGTFKKLDVD